MSAPGFLSHIPGTLVASFLLEGVPFSGPTVHLYLKIGFVERSVSQATANITFGRSRDDSFSDWHTAPRRQYAIFMSGGQMEVGMGDGTVRRFGPGDAVLFEDLTGQGHTSRTVGGDRLSAIVPLAE